MGTTVLAQRWLGVISLILLFALIVLASCSRGSQETIVPGEEWAEDLRLRIDHHIDDPKKKDQLKNLVHQDVRIFKQLANETSTYRDRLLAVDRNYLSTQENFRAVLTDYNQMRYNLRAQSMEIRFKIKALCTPDEWKHISHFRAQKGLFYQLTQPIGTN